MRLSNRRILITGANGFIGKNLITCFNELADISVTTFVRNDDIKRLACLVADADAIVHLAGENRPSDDSAYLHVNSGLTSAVCDAIRQHHVNSGLHVPLVLASSIQASIDNPYGRSKLAAELAVHGLREATGNPCTVFRLPGVFGKWCKPNYNSVVATFCHNLARDLPIRVNDPDVLLRLVYVDDVIKAILAALDSPMPGLSKATVSPEYSISLGDLAETIRGFRVSRTTLHSDRVGTGLLRALYSTYVSYLPSDKFSYAIPHFPDARGVFVEILKTCDSGQFSYFSAYPGVTRGGHYHHTKTEKFLVIKGEATFRFRHVVTNESVKFNVSGGVPTIVDTIPGWAHDITNVGDDELIVMLWANENFDKGNPDTFATIL